MHTDFSIWIPVALELEEREFCRSSEAGGRGEHCQVAPLPGTDLPVTCPHSKYNLFHERESLRAYFLSYGNVCNSNLRLETFCEHFFVLSFVSEGSWVCTGHICGTVMNVLLEWLSQSFLFPLLWCALGRGHRAHKRDPFGMKLNQKVCFNGCTRHVTALEITQINPLILLLFCTPAPPPAILIKADNHYYYCWGASEGWKQAAVSAKWCTIFLPNCKCFRHFCRRGRWTKQW